MEGCMGPPPGRSAKMVVYRKERDSSPRRVLHSPSNRPEGLGVDPLQDPRAPHPDVGGEARGDVMEEIRRGTELGDVLQKILARDLAVARMGQASVVTEAERAFLVSELQRGAPCVRTGAETRKAAPRARGPSRRRRRPRSRPRRAGARGGPSRRDHPGRARPRGSAQRGRRRRAPGRASRPCRR